MGDVGALESFKETVASLVSWTCHSFVLRQLGISVWKLKLENLSRLVRAMREAVLDTLQNGGLHRLLLVS